MYKIFMNMVTIQYILFKLQYVAEHAYIGICIWSNDIQLYGDKSKQNSAVQQK
jgi:hypothetical protein